VRQVRTTSLLLYDTNNVMVAVGVVVLYGTRVFRDDTASLFEQEAILK
jgi:hypothetical protein